MSRRAHPPVRKSLGQHFLSDRRILGRIADALEPVEGRVVVEIGPGRGSLTEVLLERGHRVVAIEIDRMLVAHLAQRFAGAERLRVIEADVLHESPGERAGSEYVLVGNVPYYITTPILFHALAPPRPARAVFLVQREVAERMSAAAGEQAYGALSANLQALTHVETLFRVPAGAFTPPPRVESAVVRVTPLEHPLVGPDEEERYRTLVLGVFGQRRKQMRRILRGVRALTADVAETVLDAAGIAPDARPETLTPADFRALLRALP